MWMDLILRGEKTLEIRARRLSKGVYYLGMRGQIYGRVNIGESFEVQDLHEWHMLRPQHRVPSDRLPYARTWASEVREVLQMRQPVPYRHPRGAIGIVKFRVA